MRGINDALDGSQTPVSYDGVVRRARHRGGRVAESPPAWPSEKDLCDAWESGMAVFGGGHRLHAARRLRTMEGNIVTVLEAGARNTGDGPDFLGAVIEVIVPGHMPHIMRGDVEMHLRAADWFTHGHAPNPAFASVILHVVENAQGMMEIAGAPVLELKQGGQPHGRAGGGGNGRRGDFRRGIRASGRQSVASLLDSLGDARLDERAAALEGEIAVIGHEQTLYEALFRGLGYTRNMTAFQEAARLMPAETLRGLTIGAPDETALITRLTGLLFGTAGLLPSQRGVQASRPSLFTRQEGGEREAGGGGDRDTASSQRVLLKGQDGGGGRDRDTSSSHPDLFKRQEVGGDDRFLWSTEAEWSRHRGLESLRPGSWQTFRVRPDNHPVRRMAAAVSMMRRWLSGPGLPDELRERMMQSGSPRDGVARMIDLLTIMPDGYWTLHRDFAKELRGRPSALLGRGRALDMMATAVLPFLLAVADFESDGELERRTRQAYAILPGPDESRAARNARGLMTPRTDEPAPRLSARRYQGFLSTAGIALNGERERIV